MSNGNIKGIDKLLKKLDTLNVDSKQVLKESIEKNMKVVQGEAKLLCPVEQGTLRNSIGVSVRESSNKIEGKVATNMEYAPYVEFGTGKKVGDSCGDKFAQPYLYPALKNNEEKIIKSIAKDLKMKMKEVSRK